MLQSIAVGAGITIIQLLALALPIVLFVWLIRAIDQAVSSLQAITERLASIEDAIREASARRAT